MPYRIAGIDVHKKMLAVVVADVEIDGEYHFERQKVGTSPADLRTLAHWLVAREVEEVVMESTAQSLAAGVGRAGAALATAAPGVRGRRADGGHAASRPGPVESGAGRPQEGLRGCGAPGEAAGRPGADLELCARRREAALADRDAAQVPSHAQPRPAAEPSGSAAREAHIKLSSLVSDLLGISARRMLQALADGETDPATLAALAAPRLRATPQQLCDAFSACPTLHPVYRRLVKLTLDELRIINDHLDQLDQQMADLLAEHHAAVQRLAAVRAIFTNILDLCARVVAIQGGKGQSMNSESGSPRRFCPLYSWTARVPVVPPVASRRTSAPGPSSERRSAARRHAARLSDGHVSQDADRLASTRAWRAAAARDVRSVGTPSPVPKYISSGVCPRNAECGRTRLCSST